MGIPAYLLIPKKKTDFPRYDYAIMMMKKENKNLNLNIAADIMT